MNTIAHWIAYLFLAASAAFAGGTFVAWQSAESERQDSLSRQAAVTRQAQDRAYKQQGLQQDLASLEDIGQTLIDSTGADEHWQRLFENLASELGITDLTYDIKPLAEADGLLPHNVTLQASLPHEGDFLHLLERLQQQSGAIVRLDTYRLWRTGDELRMTCQMHWLVRTGASARP